MFNPANFRLPKEETITLCNSEFSEQTGMPMLARRIKPWDWGDYFFFPLNGGIVVIELGVENAYSWVPDLSVSEFKKGVRDKTFQNDQVIILPDRYKYVGVAVYHALH